MADWQADEDRPTADRCSLFHLLTGMGVHVKTPFSSTSSATATAATTTATTAAVSTATAATTASATTAQQRHQHYHHQHHSFGKDLTKCAEEDGSIALRTKTDDPRQASETCSCCINRLEAERQGQKIAGVWGQSRQPPLPPPAQQPPQRQLQLKEVVVVTGLLCGMTLLLCFGFGAYVLHQARQEMMELRQTVQRLDAECGHGSGGGGVGKDAAAAPPPFSSSSSWLPASSSSSSSSAAASQHPSARSGMGPYVPAASRHSRRADDGSPARLMHDLWYGDDEPGVFDKKAEDAHGTASDYADGKDDRGDSPYSFYVAPSRQKRRARQAKSRMCKKLESCMKAKETGKKGKRKCAKMLKCLPPPAPPAIKPVHFMGTYPKEDRQKKYGKDSLLYFNTEADWMAELYPDESQQPIVRLRDGGYKVTQSGIYFVYTSVMFHDLKPRLSQSVVVNGERKLKCMESTDYINNTLHMNEQRKYKTCSISGLIRLKVNDRLEVQNAYNATEIIHSEDSTYFGALLLFPLELKRF